MQKIRLLAGKRHQAVSWSEVCQGVLLTRHQSGMQHDKQIRAETSNLS